MDAYERAGVSPDTVTYIEAHGTGTELGDPVEVNGLKKAFSGLYRKFDMVQERSNYCGLGSVKSNIGHLETAAGIAGVLKVLLALKHKKIPATINYKEPNAYIDLKGSPFYIVDKAVDWQQLSDQNGNLIPRRAGVSSFGFGGSNAHAIIEEYIPNPGRNKTEIVVNVTNPVLIVLSAKNGERLKVYAKKLHSFLVNKVDALVLPDIAYTLQMGREEMDSRLALLVDSKEDLLNQLRAFIENRDSREKSYTGEVKKGSDTLALYTVDDDLKEVINKWMSHGKIDKLAELWVKGLSIQWDKLYGKVKPKRLSLPTYPFLEEIYCIQNEDKKEYSDAGNVVLSLHPLLQRNMSDLAEQRYTTKLTGNESFLNTNLNIKDKMLPEVACLEMARAAGRMAAGNDVLTIKDVVWAMPIHVNKKPLEVSISLFPEDSHIEFEISSRASMEEAELNVHSQGKLEIGDYSEQTARYIDINAIRSRCGDELTGTECYENLTNLGKSYSPEFQSVQSLYYKQGEALVELRLPNGVAEIDSQFMLHPTLLDGVIQSIVGVLTKKLFSDVINTLCPYKVRKIKIYDNVQERAFAYIKYSLKTRDEDYKTKYDVDISDDNGRVLVSLAGLELMPVEGTFSDEEGRVKEDSSMVSEESENKIKEPFKLMTFEEEWQEADLSEIDISTLELGNIICFVHGKDQHKELQDYIKKCNRKENIFFVNTGNSFKQKSQYEYEINLNKFQSYQRLFASIEKVEQKINSLLFFSAFRDDMGKKSLKHIFYLLNAIKSTPIFINRILMGGKLDNGKTQCYAESWLGYERSLGLIMPHTNLSCVYMGAQSFSFGQCCDYMFQEAAVTNEIQQMSVRYQSGQRYVYKIKEIKKTNRYKNSIKPQGTYLITGGCGGLGSLFAGYLAERYKVRLILTGRSALDTKKEKYLKDLQNKGAVVCYEQVDISHREQMTKMLQRIKRRFGGINGVIHAAGVESVKTVFDKKWSGFKQILLPKVQGTVVLDEITAREPLDFTCYFSSSSAVLGDFGACDYAIGNRFQMAYGQYRTYLTQEGKRNGKTIVINWPLWREGGMGVRDDENTEMYLKSSGQRFLEKEEGFEAFEDLLCQERTSTLVLCGQKSRLERFLKIEGKSISDLKTAKDIQAGIGRLTGYESLSIHECIQRDLSRMISKLLKIKDTRVAVNENLLDFGFESISLAEFARMLSSYYGLNITPTVFFGYPTIEKLGQYFTTNHKKTITDFYGKKTDKEQKPVHISLKNTNISIREPLTPLKKDRFKVIQNGHAHVQYEPIAIIGASGRFPQSENKEIYWDHLYNKENLITEVPPERFDWRKYYGDSLKDSGKTNSKWGGFIPDIDKFDPLFFGISPKEAEMMDPQHRIFLEEVWHAIEDAGYAVSSLSGRGIGLFVGVQFQEYQQLLAKHFGKINAQIVTGNSHAMLANRVSYQLNIHGPSEAISTACSASLVAIHRAVESIQNGESELAIAGGVSMNLLAETWVGTSQLGVLSPDGKCKTFDKKADGFVKGEGAGAILLKPLSQAKTDRDFIYGIIKGSAVNHGGKSNSLTSPNLKAQSDLLVTAYKMAGVSPETINYIETHGTGTKLGDPVEVEGLKDAFSRLYEINKKEMKHKNYCGLGAVKTNVGHLEPAAGIAGVFKVLLGIQHECFPANLNFEETNPHIDLKDSPFYLVNETQKWKTLYDDQNNPIPKRAGISSFGFGGTNAHVVIEEYLPVSVEHGPVKIINAKTPALVVLSAKNSERLKVYAERLLGFIKRLDEGGKESRSLADIAYTLQVGREAMDYRVAFLIKGKKELAAKLEAFIAEKGDKNDIDALYSGEVRRDRNALAFFASDEDTKELITKWIEKGKYDKIAELWVNGFNLDWELLYGDCKPKRISLPTYPFAREHYWIPGAEGEIVDQKRESMSGFHQTTQKSNLDPEYVIEKDQMQMLSKQWHSERLTDTIAQEKGEILLLVTPDILTFAETLFAGSPGINTFICCQNEAMKRVDDNHYELDFYHEEQGIAVYQQWSEKRSDDLIGCMDLTALSTDYDDSKAVEAGKLVFLQQLIEHKRGTGLKLVQITSNLQDYGLKTTRMNGARLAGLYRMLGAEYKQVVSKTVDIDVSLNDRLKLKETLIQEWSSSDKHNECCYRNGIRHVSTLKVIQSGLEIEEAATNGQRYPSDRVLVITGGTRGIGEAVAKHMVAKGVRRLVLMGREPLPERFQWQEIISDRKTSPVLRQKILDIQWLEAHGAEVEIYCGSLTDRKALLKLFKLAKKKMGEVFGVIHCAGVVKMENPAFIRNSVSYVREVCEPKVEGLACLHEVLKQEPIEFFVLFSSVSAIIPTLASGQAIYGMANAYMDFFASYQYRQGYRYYRSLNWPNWKEKGVGGDVSPAYQRTGLLSHDTKAGLKLMDAAIALKDIPVCMPCESRKSGPWFEDLLKTELICEITLPPVSKKRMAAHKTIKNGDIQELEVITLEWLKELFAKVLKIDAGQLDPDVSFSEYGVDSILLAELVREIEKELEMSLDPSVILECPQLSLLVNYIVEEFGDKLILLFKDRSSRCEMPKEPSSIYDDALDQKPDQVSQIKKNIDQVPLQNGVVQAEKIAVVGLACHFPGAPDIDTFWFNLKSGTDSIIEVPANRWDIRKYYSTDYQPGKSISKWGGFIEGIEEFDPEYFGISKELAPHIDPLMRQFLEVGVEVINDAGYTKKEIWGKDVGVFVGSRISNFVYYLPNVLKESIVGTGQNFIAALLSHIYNLKGPNMVIDTACSSSLSSLHLACQSLAKGESEMAIAGGVDVLLDQLPYIALSEGRALSPDGRCYTFDQRANGFVPGEGCGAVLLKPLKKAIMDNDRVYGIIEATAMNNDGNTMGITTPNPDAQREVIQKALQKSQVNIRSITYMETHGTGTMIGDPMELKGLTSVFRRFTQDQQFCAVGSVKSNVGHLLSAAGIASLIKVMLSIYHQQIPPTLHCTKPNSRFVFKQSPFYPNIILKEWLGYKGVRRAGISSFGFGGTNVHVIASDQGLEYDSKNVKRQPLPIIAFNRKYFWPVQKDNKSKVMSGFKESLTPGNDGIDLDEIEFDDFFKTEKLPGVQK
ncbi:difficidin polyketide synthase [Candidatus Scalindua japonica]|uniref:Difficidin polyketide synthase n=1 Tax=Candidatus Scalindua japonica TaxID=1284222 RepID=A0A286TWI3_9BACT|nr:SDR family NAD(P)-dependent oxidoreductase [Candidatus Scalindua japonica]GAX60240.1 difficidin polyketide synthase [Candidatus Scalindua japonica]